jgi:DNA-binding beta-propeller fold protein YncE
MLKNVSPAWGRVFAAAIAIGIGAYALAAVAPHDPPSHDITAGELTAPGKLITPTAAHGAIFQDLEPGLPGAPHLHANHAAAVSVSPDGRLLAVLTSGHNLHYEADGTLNKALSNEYVFLFDIEGARPTQLQALQIPNTFHGMAWGVGSDRLYVSGGKDDLVAEFARRGSTFERSRTFALGHHEIVGPAPMPWLGGPTANGLAVSPDGSRLLVSNMMNDSVSLIDVKAGRVVAERDLRPGKIDPSRVGQPGGSYPGSVVWISNERAYVASERDREVIALDVTPGMTVSVGKRMTVDGQPVALLANRSGSRRLFAALDNVDRVAIVDTETNALIEQVAVLAPESVYINTKKLGGANPNALALTPDEQMLLVSNGGQNAVAIVSLNETHHSAVVGLIPTGWYPTGIATRKDGSAIYIVNGKSPTGPNSSWCQEPAGGTCYGEIPKNNEQGWAFAPNGIAFQKTKDATVIQMQKAGFLTVPTPTPGELARLTQQVARNNGFDRPDKAAADAQLLSFLRQHIEHVIYIIKENRSYDQILGDLEVGNGDPRLALFPDAIAPNHHALARNFVTLDNFLVSGEGSWTGWLWSTAARTSVFAERNDFVNLAQRGGDMAGFGNNRMLNVSLPTNAARKAEDPHAPSDPDVLPGARGVAELDGPGGEQGKGYIWDAALRAGLTVRSYGVSASFDADAKPIREPFAEHKPVASSFNAALRPFTDVYYANFDLRVPDYWRYKEWKREFDEFVRSGTLPTLTLMGLSGDHFGQFEKAIDDVNTPPRQMASNDYALGQIIEAVANSPFADSTLIVTIEDDTWDGVDHVDAFRSPAFFVGPYVRKHALVSTRYTTVNVVKTIDEILGIGPVGINDAMAAPMSDVFDATPAAAAWSFQAIVPGILRSTQLPLPPPSRDRAETSPIAAEPKHSPRYWARAMADQDFSGRDAGEFGAGNRGLWRGLKGNQPYPQRYPQR